MTLSKNLSFPNLQFTWGRSPYILHILIIIVTRPVCRLFAVVSIMSHWSILIYRSHGRLYAIVRPPFAEFRPPSDVIMIDVWGAITTRWLCCHCRRFQGKLNIITHIIVRKKLDKSMFNKIELRFQFKILTKRNNLFFRFFWRIKVWFTVLQVHPNKNHELIFPK